MRPARVPTKPMKPLPFLLAATLAAALSLAGKASASPARHSITTPARALHTGVHTPAHAAHHRRIHRTHGRATVRASISGAVPGPHLPAPAAPATPERRPARSHATLPHAGAKVHRTPTRGGQPYPLGHASPSLALETGCVPLDATRNETVTSPARGILKGRSPPRGDPLCATSLPLPARDAPLLRAPVRPSSTFGRLAIRAPACDRSTAPVPNRPSDRCLSLFTTDRAPEGGPVGLVSPSRRCFT